jgi:LemA protein
MSELGPGTIAASIFGVLAAGFIWSIWTRNKFARLLVKIIESDSGIEVALTKRFDTLYKMLDVVKGYAKHEAEVLTAVVKLRKGMSLAERSNANSQMDELAGKINLLAESYPDLKASINFKEMQTSVVEVEEHLQAARRIYNMNVSQYNQLLASWPQSIIGNIMKLTNKSFFEAENRKKEDLKISF